jgi:hypothetical protein
MHRESEDGVNQNIKLNSWYRLLINCVEGIHKGSNKMIKYYDKVFYHAGVLKLCVSQPFSKYFQNYGTLECYIYNEFNVK